MNRTHLRRTIALGIGAVALAVPAATTAVAAPIAAPLTWAAFTNAPAWNNPADNVQWYVASPVITKSMVGKRVTLTATSPEAVDCRALGAGYPTGSGWHALTTTSATCSATTVRWSFTATRDMVGRNVFLNAWSAVPSGDATITGTVAIGKNKATAASTAERPAPTAPCSGTKPFGPVQTFKGAAMNYTVSLASNGASHEIWYDGTCYPGPTGRLLDQTGVSMVAPGDERFHVTAFDPATRRLSTFVMAFHSSPSGLQTATETTTRQVDGDHVAYMSDSYKASYLPSLYLMPVDGRPTLTLRFHEAQTGRLTAGTIRGWTTTGNVTTITYTGAYGDQGVYTCTATLAGTTCPATLG